MDYDDFEPNNYIEHLSDVEHSRYLTFKHIKRKREFIATRILRKRALGAQRIQYNSIGAPYIDGIGFISISHSSYLVGLAFNKDYMVGLDLETPRENILDILSTHGFTTWSTLPEIRWGKNKEGQHQTD